MVGALASGAIGDFVGRRKVMLLALAWFSVGMAATALTTSVTLFGAFRFFTGIGVGALVATAGAIVAEFAPKNRRNLCNAIVYSGVPAGGVLASLLALGFGNGLDWRPLFWIGAVPLVTILPLALAKLPESPMWLLSRGRREEAEELSRRTGVVLPEAGPTPAAARTDGAPRERAGFAGLAPPAGVGAPPWGAPPPPPPPPPAPRASAPGSPAWPRAASPSRRRSSGS